VVSANNLTIEGAKPDASAVMTDKTCQGKALLVTTGKGITLRNLTLQRARVPDNNGAGIRVEGANLTIERVKFINNQNGILAANNPESTITIRDSEFLRNGFCSPCAHGIYVNQVKLLRIERSRFADTRRAHHIKSRALRTEIIQHFAQAGAEELLPQTVHHCAGGQRILLRNQPLREIKTGGFAAFDLWPRKIVRQGGLHDFPALVHPVSARQDAHRALVLRADGDQALG
jgi:hypothetical protein